MLLILLLLLLNNKQAFDFFFFLFIKLRQIELNIKEKIQTSVDKTSQFILRWIHIWVFAIFYVPTEVEKQGWEGKLG